MKLNIERLATHLAPNRFTRIIGDVSDGECAFVRPDTRPCLYQWVVIDCAGRKREAVAAWVGVSVTQRISFKGLMEVRLLDEMAEDKVRGWTILDSRAKAEAWERQLARVAPARTSEFAAEIGINVLARTNVARIAVERYLELLAVGPRTVAERLSDLRQEVDEVIIADAERLATWPGVLQLAGAEDHYLLATLCIIRFERQVEASSATFLGDDPLVNEHLMWRMQLLADALLVRSQTPANDSGPV